HRVGAVALQVGEEVVVGVLQGGLFAGEDVAVAQRGEDGGDGGFAHVAAAAGAVPGDELGEGGDAGGADDLHQLGAGVGEVLAQRRGLLHPGVAEEGFEHRDAGAAAGAGAGGALEGGDVGGAAGDGGAQLALGDGVAGADLGVVGQRGGAGGAAGGAGRGDQGQRVAGELPADEGAQRG